MSRFSIDGAPVTAGQNPDLDRALEAFAAERGITAPTVDLPASDLFEWLDTAPSGSSAGRIDFSDALAPPVGVERPQFLRIASTLRNLGHRSVRIGRFDERAEAGAMRYNARRDLPEIVIAGRGSEDGLFIVSRTESRAEELNGLRHSSLIAAAAAHRYVETGDPLYRDRALDVLDTWAEIDLPPATGRQPDDTWISLGRFLPQMIGAAETLTGAGVAPEELAPFANWLGSAVVPQLQDYQQSRANNHASWATTSLAATGSFFSSLESHAEYGHALLIDAEREFRRDLGVNGGRIYYDGAEGGVRPDGTQPLEIRRGDDRAYTGEQGLLYSNFNLRALTATAEILRRNPETVADPYATQETGERLFAAYGTTLRWTLGAVRGLDPGPSDDPYRFPRYDQRWSEQRLDNYGQQGHYIILAERFGDDTALPFAESYLAATGEDGAPGAFLQTLGADAAALIASTI
ncbi:MAG: alginate lyase family protein [Myxococcota bacterium]